MTALSPYLTIPVNHEVKSILVYMSIYFSTTPRLTPGQVTIVFFILNIYLFIWLCGVLAAAGRLLSCSMRTLSCGMHVRPGVTVDKTTLPKQGAQV